MKQSTKSNILKPMEYLIAKCIVIQTEYYKKIL